MSRRTLTDEEIDLLRSGVDLLIDRGQKHVIRWDANKGSLERRDLLGRELNMLRDLRDELRVGGVQLP